MESVNSNIIQGLWIGGTLSKVEQLCIKSFLDNGHEFHLYTYEEVQNIPAGTIVCDGNDILDKENIFTYKSGWGKGSVSGFADIFRVHLLFKKGGWWVDMDIICLKRFDNEKQAVICSSHEGQYGSFPNNCVLRFPKNDPILKYCIDKINNIDVHKMSFGMAGPFLFQQTVTDLKLENIVAPYYYFNPIAWSNLGELVLGQITTINKLKELFRPYLKPNTMPGRSIKKGSYSVHLWNEVWANGGFDKNGTYPRYCLFERLKRKHGID
jgi:hypothetical protein